MVAGMNAPNVWMMETLARLLPAGSTARAALEAEAAALAQAILSLYEAPQGVFRALYPNGTSMVVRHVIDFSYVSQFMSAHLPPLVQSEMADFVQRELLTPNWMRALSLSDAMANFSDRTDHGPNGAYPGWLPGTIAGLARAGNWSAAWQLLNASAEAIALGPFGQVVNQKKRKKKKEKRQKEKKGKKKKKKKTEKIRQSDGKSNIK
jgi:hypothetical protein